MRNREGECTKKPGAWLISHGLGTDPWHGGRMRIDPVDRVIGLHDVDRSHRTAKRPSGSSSGRREKELEALEHCQPMGLTEGREDEATVVWRSAAA